MQLKSFQNRLIKEFISEKIKFQFLYILRRFHPLCSVKSKIFYQKYVTFPRTKQESEVTICEQSQT